MYVKGKEVFYLGCPTLGVRNWIFHLSHVTPTHMSLAICEFVVLYLD